MQRLSTLIPAALLTTAVVAPAIAVCAWLALVLTANVAHFAAQRHVARVLVIAGALTAPLLYLAAASTPLALCAAGVLAVAAFVRPFRLAV